MWILFWSLNRNSGNLVGTIMVDFRKAFDLVDHSLLLKKLGIYKCSEHFIKFMDSEAELLIKQKNI